MKFRTDEEKHHNLKLLTRLQLKKKSMDEVQLSHRKNFKLTICLRARYTLKNLGALTNTAFFYPINTVCKFKKNIH